MTRIGGAIGGSLFFLALAFGCQGTKRVYPVPMGSTASTVSPELPSTPTPGPESSGPDGGTVGSGEGMPPLPLDSSSQNQAMPPICATGTHLCGSACASNGDVASCASSCAACPVPSGGTATCDGTACGIACPDGLRACGGDCVDPNQACNGACPTGSHACAGACAADTSTSSCGTSCDPCAVPDHGTATCDGVACAFTCEDGYHACGTSCASNTDVATCGASCGPCPVPVGGAATCDGTTCGGTCPAGQKLCAGACIAQNQSCMGACPSGTHDCAGTCQPNTSVNTCGSSCAPCAVPPNAVPSCDGTSCGFSCQPGFHACGGACVSNTSPASCGSSCNACSAPAGGNATCDGTACGIACNQGFHQCGAGCAANNNVNSCGNSSCSPCPVPANGSATCNGATCGIACNQGFHPCGTACVANNSVNSCGNSCSACAAPANGTATCDGTRCGVGCSNGLSACGNACVNVASDPNNCGVCGHSCLGASCSGGTCAATVLATNESVISLSLGANDVFYNGATQLRRVSKLGGSPQTLFDTSSGTVPASVRGLAVDGNVAFFGVDVNQASPQILQISPGRESVFNNLAEVGELDNLVASAGLLYWADNGSFWSAPTTQSGAGVQRVGDATSTNDPSVVVGGCVYATRFPAGGGQLQLVRVCSGGTPQIQFTDNNISAVTTDNSAVYLVDSSNAVRRVAATGNPPSATTIVTPTPGDEVIALAVDGSSAYYAEGTAGFMTCTSNWTINRVPKAGGAVVPLVKPPINCPTQLVVDDQFLYVAAVGDNANNTATIFRVPK